MTEQRIAVAGMCGVGDCYGGGYGRGNGLNYGDVRDGDYYGGDGYGHSSGDGNGGGYGYGNDYVGSGYSGNICWGNPSGEAGHPATEADGSVDAWWFSPDGLVTYGGAVIKVEPGLVMKWHGPLVMCVSGLHASRTIAQARRYRVGWLYRVRCSVDIQWLGDKLVCRRREYLAVYMPEEAERM